MPSDIASLQVSIARIEEQLKSINQKLADIQGSQSEREDWEKSIDNEMRGIKSRLDAIENKGLAAWAPKKVAQFTALVTVGSGLVAFIIKAVGWIVDHWPHSGK